MGSFDDDLTHTASHTCNSQVLLSMHAFPASDRCHLSIISTELAKQKDSVILRQYGLALERQEAHRYVTALCIAQISHINTTASRSLAIGITPCGGEWRDSNGIFAQQAVRTVLNPTHSSTGCLM